MKEASDRCVCANVCRVERVFELAGRGARVVLLMELCEGGDLLSRLQARGGRLGAAEGARAISMIARGLRALHEGGILHLDLKPENCLYETAAADATLKITDFGLAKHRDDDPAEERAPPRIVGTLGYMAPEIVLQRPATPAADVFSLGTVAFLLLSGTQAIALHGLSQREKLVRTLQCLVDFRPEAWAGVSPDAKVLCEMCRPGQETGAPTSKAPSSAGFRSFRLIFGRAIISRNGLEAWMLSLERARAEHSR